MPDVSRKHSGLEMWGIKYPVICHHFLVYTCSGDVWTLHCIFSPPCQSIVSAHINQSFVTCYPIFEVSICDDYVLSLDFGVSLLSLSRHSEIKNKHTPPLLS
jgi:hypothetical protein